MYKNLLKRVIDFLIAFSGLILLSPVFLIVLVVLYFQNDGKPFFFQRRPGLNEKMFNIIKFKTMTDKKDSKGNYLPDADRLTPMGSFIRQTSLDEIPQLINVLKGDMAIIGPRPLLPQYLPLYNESQKRRHEVRPGITGWAQVNGRNAISWAKKFELDVWYIDHVSFVLDCKIVLLTVKKVFKKEGINKEGQATTEAFNGNN
ncbi:MULTISPECIES: sugar transferase [Chryseobacterium]|jgi:lipopolysaccharide/colanic/teichoic acid biosynthesis glycosyltransferase|uniref:Sugar transferase n=1 Tax=Chryseobacterium nepalense TaxID=1854498 RepID=A0ABY4K5X8_9FLAO|nr:MULTISPECIES: sugar transferase [Chryseobacterium]MEA1848719.1 sugar transferase [Chryseobacterium sp. MHB01]UPQ76191.1 sugar transferase [Chryseobacterium nepalense]